MTDYSPLSRSFHFLADFRALRVSVDYAAGLSPDCTIIPERWLKNADHAGMITALGRRGVFTDIALSSSLKGLSDSFREVALSGLPQVSNHLTTISNKNQMRLSEAPYGGRSGRVTRDPSLCSDCLLGQSACSRGKECGRPSIHHRASVFCRARTL